MRPVSIDSGRRVPLTSKARKMRCHAPFVKYVMLNSAGHTCAVMLLAGRKLCWTARTYMPTLSCVPPPDSTRPHGNLCTHVYCILPMCLSCCLCGYCYRQICVHARKIVTQLSRLSRCPELAVPCSCGPWHAPPALCRATALSSPPGLRHSSVHSQGQHAEISGRSACRILKREKSMWKSGGGEAIATFTSRR